MPRLTNMLSKLLDGGSFSVIGPQNIDQIGKRVISALRVVGRRVTETYYRLVSSNFVLKTLAEFLKCAGAPMVLLFVQSFLPILLITVVITAIAVLVERYLERQAHSSRGTLEAESARS